MVIKASFTAKEHRRLLELVHLGMWTVTCYQGENSAVAQRNYPRDQKLFSKAGLATVRRRRKFAATRAA